MARLYIHFGMTALLAALAFAPLRAEDAPAPEKKPAAETPKAGDADKPKDEAAPKEQPKPIEVDDGIAPPPPDIFAAAKGNNLEYVKKFVEADPKLVNERSALKDTPLHWATSCGCTEIVKYLVEKGADVNAQNLTGKTPLHLATLRSNKDYMKLFIAAKANPNIKADDPTDDSSGETCLHFAVARCKPDIVELLLEAKADVKATTKSGATALEYAKKRDRTDLVKLLQKYGATDEE
jgi:ankyrin repeat protein